MGFKDFDRLSPIFTYTMKINKDENLGFKFDLDSGHHETAIQIYENGMVIRPPMQNAMIFNKILEPDIMDYRNKIIIEFEEEAKPSTGFFHARLRHGHFPELLNQRDEERDKFYTKVANPPFRLLKIWQSNKNWKEDLSVFLVKCKDIAFMPGVTT